MDSPAPAEPTSPAPSSESKLLEELRDKLESIPLTKKYAKEHAEAKAAIKILESQLGYESAGSGSVYAGSDSDSDYDSDLDADWSDLLDDKRGS